MKSFGDFRSAIEEVKSHTVPKTEKEKDLADLAPPKGKITHADIMVGRGVTKEEEEMDEMSSKEKMKRGLYNKEDVTKVVKDASGKPVSWSTEGEWKKSQKKNPIGTVAHMSDVAVKQTQKMAKEDFNSMAGYMSQIAKDAGYQVEKTLTPAELKKREEIAQAMERENPGMDKSKKMAIATATAKKVAEETEDMHYCAKHVYSEELGEGLVIEGQHAEPNAEGHVEWYMVEFASGVEKVMTENVKVMAAEYHMNHKMKKEEAPAKNTDIADKKAKMDRLKDTKSSALHNVAKGMKAFVQGKQEPMESVEVAEEALDEISNQTKKDYVSAAALDAVRYGNTLGRAQQTGAKSVAKLAGDKITKRLQGIKTATGKITNEEAEEVQEAMISYSDFKDKIDMHRKAGNKVVDDKYDDKKATYTTIDKEGHGRKVTHTATGSKQETLGKVTGDDDQEDEVQVKPTEKRGRGRPSGSLSGARRHN